MRECSFTDKNSYNFKPLKSSDACKGDCHGNCTYAEVDFASNGYQPKTKEDCTSCVSNLIYIIRYKIITFHESHSRHLAYLLTEDGLQTI